MIRFTTIAFGMSAFVFQIGCAAISTPYSGPDPESILAVEADADTIYQGARQWFAENFKSANAVIQYESEATNTVIGRGRSTMVCVKPSGEQISLSEIAAAQCMTVRDVEFVVKVEAKDARMRVSVPQVLVVYPPSQYSNGGTNPATSEVMAAVSDSILEYGESIKDYIESGVKAEAQW